MLHVPTIGCALSSAPTLTSSCILQAFIVSGSSMDVPAQGMDYCNSSIHWCRLQARSSCSRAEGLVFIGGSVPRCLPRPKPPRGRRQLPPRSGTAASCTGSPRCCHAAHPPACAPPSNRFTHGMTPSHVKEQQTPACMHLLQVHAHLNTSLRTLPVGACEGGTHSVADLLIGGAKDIVMNVLHKTSQLSVHIAAA